MPGDNKTEQKPPTTTTRIEEKRYTSSLKSLNFQAVNLSQEWEGWILQFKVFLIATGLDKEPDARKVSILLHHMGPESLKIFQTFRDMKLESTKYDELVTKFAAYFTPKKSLCINRHKFFTTTQKTKQSITEYLTQLKVLAADCEFKEEDNMVRDIFICGLISENNFIKERLLEAGDVTLDKCVEIAQTLDVSWKRMSVLTEPSSSMETFQIHNHASRSKSRNAFGQWSHPNRRNRSVSSNRSYSTVNNQSNCTRCGQMHKYRCPAMGCFCHKCGGKNHYAQFCFAKQQSSNYSHGNKQSFRQMKSNQSNVKYVQSDENSSDVPEFFVGSVDGDKDTWNVEMLVIQDLKSISCLSIPIVSYYFYL